MEATVRWESGMLFRGTAGSGGAVTLDTRPDMGGTGPGTDIEDEPPLLLGDVVICPEVATRNAAEHDNTYDDEVALLIVHGILHLMGMDHEHDDEAEVMEARERELLEKFHRPVT